MNRFLLALVIALSLVTHVAAADKIAIIIDDIGNHPEDLAAAELPGDVTFAVLPFTPYGRAFALKAHHQGKQIMAHVPMQALAGNALGLGALTADMSSAEIKLKLRQVLDDIPYVAGINNHMGSQLTQLTQPMQAVMESLKNHDLYFIDSRTTEYTVAEQIAHRYQVPVARRHVFIDNETNEQYLSQQFDELIRLARQQGTAIAIGHPYPETIAFLKQRLSTLEQEGIQLVFASELTLTSELSIPSGLLETRQ
tara:strand:+ start:2712 stop:3470 length:759 start_codon:yes stop_codon:yes gene_type:complete